jgi:predicted transcriptional regulator
LFRHISARTTRSIRLLRAHGLIRKVSGTRYYRVTEKGHHVMSTAIRLREIDVARLAA